MTDKLVEKCAVAAVWGNSQAAPILQTMLEALQHRGQDATGIATYDAHGITRRHASLGLVADVYDESTLNNLPGSVAIGHNRYATSSSVHEISHLQPFTTEADGWSLAHNGNLSVTTPLINFLIDKKIPKADTLNDSGMIHAAIGWHLGEGKGLVEAISSVYPLLVGAFSCVAMYNGTLVAFRDGHGIRPLSYGHLPGGGYAIASETRALDALQATNQADVLPGQLIAIDKTGCATHTIVEAQPKLDIFELVYFARGSSRMCGRLIGDIRYDFGAQLAREYPMDQDERQTTIVVPVPNSAVPAAKGYASECNLPYAEGIQRATDLRTFIQPDQDSRRTAVRKKLIPNTAILDGKRVVLIEDSIVRGTTLGVLIQMLREVGAKEIHVRISSPPVKFPNFYGINMPSQNELIAHGRTIEEICTFIGADSLGYLSVQGMLRATGYNPESFDTSVFTGMYPVDIGAHRHDIVEL